MLKTKLKQFSEEKWGRFVWVMSPKLPFYSRSSVSTAKEKKLLPTRSGIFYNPSVNLFLFPEEEEKRRGECGRENGAEV